MAEPGDIIDIPYEEGHCVRCGWTVTRDDKNTHWTGRLGGDCRAHADGEHYVRTVVQRTRQARVTERIMIRVLLLGKQGLVIARQDIQGPGLTWHETLPPGVEEVVVTSETYRYAAALD